MLKRNCALSPRQLALFYATLVAVSSLIGIGFALTGAWLVLPFAGIEMVALGAALLHHGRHVGDREVVSLEADALRVEVTRAGRVESVSFDPYWVRVELAGEELRDGQAAAEHGEQAGHRGRARAWRAGAATLRIWLRQGRRALMVGQFVAEDQRTVFARELQGALAGLRFAGAGAPVKGGVR